MSVRAQVLTQWVGSGAEADPRRPKLLDDYVTLSYRDVSGTPPGNLPPAPNVLLVEVLLDDAVYSAVEADANYDPQAIVWSE